MIQRWWKKLETAVIAWPSASSFFLTFWIHLSILMSPSLPQPAVSIFGFAICRLCGREGHKNPRPHSH